MILWVGTEEQRLQSTSVPGDGHLVLTEDAVYVGDGSNTLPNITLVTRNRQVVDALREYARFRSGIELWANILREISDDHA